MPKFGALDNSIIGSHARRDFRQRLEDQGFTCFWCGSPISDPELNPETELAPKNKAVPDHLLPKSRGGVDFIWNIVASCEACNHLRNNRLPGEFLSDRLAFARPVDERAKKPTVIPLFRERAFDGTISVHSHLEISDIAAQLIRNLDRKMPHMDMTEEQVSARKKFLLEQAARLMVQRQRMTLEAAGQMTLLFDRPKPIAQATSAISDRRQA